MLILRNNTRLLEFCPFRSSGETTSKDILPQKSKGVLYVVLEHTCGKGQAFTYQLDGPQTTFLGVGDDVHDPKYDYIGYSATLSELTDTSNSDRESAYTGPPLDNFCPTSLKVYPSQDMEDGYKTSNQ